MFQHVVRNKNNKRPIEGIPSGRNRGAWIGLQVIRTTYPPSQSVRPRFSGKNSPAQLFRLTRQHATLNRGQESGLEGALLSQLLDAVPLDFLNMFPAMYVFIKENTLVILNWKKQRK